MALRSHPLLAPSCLSLGPHRAKAASPNEVMEQDGSRGRRLGFLLWICCQYTVTLNWSSSLWAWPLSSELDNLFYVTSSHLPRYESSRASGYEPGTDGSMGRLNMVHGSRTENGSAPSHSKQNLTLTLALLCHDQTCSQSTFLEQLSTLSAPKSPTFSSFLCPLFDFSPVK